MHPAAATKAIAATNGRQRGIDDDTTSKFELRKGDFMRRVLVAVVILIVMPLAALAQQTAMRAANVAGTWSGSFRKMVDGKPASNDLATVVLKQEGSVLTGTAGPPQGQNAISHGKVVTTKDGTVITFDIVNGNGMTLQFELKLTGGHLKGTAKAEQNGQQLNAMLDLERAKAP